MSYIYGFLPPISSLRPFDGILPIKPHITIVRIKKPKIVSLDLRPFMAKLGDVVLLPSRSKPRYIALEVEPYHEFLRLRKALEALLGDYVDERHGQFKPHLTVYSIRLKRPTPDDLEPALREASTLTGSAFEVKNIALIDATGGEYKQIYVLELR